MLILQANSQRLMCVRVRGVGACVRVCMGCHRWCFLFLLFEQPQWGYIDM